jgi:hypothetical protein
MLKSNQLLTILSNGSFCFFKSHFSNQIKINEKDFKNFYFNKKFKKKNSKEKFLYRVKFLKV